MSWKQIDHSSKWSAPLDGHERFLGSMGELGRPEKEGWAMKYQFKLAQSDMLTIDNIRAAWTHLRFEHPSLAAKLSEDRKEKTYTVPAAADIPAWLDETVVVSDTLDSEVLIKTDKPHDLATLFWLPNASEMIFHSSHWRIDGMGCFHVMNRYFEILSKLSSMAPVSSIRWADEIQNLGDSLEVAAGITSEADTEAAKAAVQKKMNAFVEAGQNTGLGHLGDGTQPLAQTGREIMSFSEESTDAFVKACRARGWTVAPVIHAASIVATFESAPESHKKNGYVGLSPVNMRPYLPVPYDGPTRGSGVFVSGHGMFVPAGSDFEAAAQSLNKQYKEQSPRNGDFMQQLREWGSAVGMAFVMGMNPPKGMPLVSDIFVSSLGLLEKQGFVGTYEGLKVEDIKVFVEVCSTQVAIHPFTYDGSLRFCTYYNEAFHTKLRINTILTRMRSILEEGMNIKIDSAFKKA